MEQMFLGLTEKLEGVEEKGRNCEDEKKKKKDRKNESQNGDKKDGAKKSWPSDYFENSGLAKVEGTRRLKESWFWVPITDCDLGFPNFLYFLPRPEIVNLKVLRIVKKTIYSDNFTFISNFNNQIITLLLLITKKFKI